MKSENISIGIDTEEISRFDKYAEDKNSDFLSRIYTDKEIEYCFQKAHPSSHLAVRFCAKEAIYKAMCGFGIKIPDFKNIEIYNDENNIPHVNLQEEYKNYKVKITLSHSKTNAIAQALIIKED